MNWDFSPKSISNEWVTLEPLSDSHLDELCGAMIPDPKGWYSVMFGLETREAYLSEIRDSENFRKAMNGMGFAIRDNSTGELVGISFFMKMDSENRNLEIGTTIIAPKFRRTKINSAAKLAMLREAFEVLGCIRVSFRVDRENVISREAIERLGAVHGGLLRSERILPDGRIRDYDFYSIISSEWPSVKSRLKNSLNRPHLD